MTLRLSAIAAAALLLVACSSPQQGGTAHAPGPPLKNTIDFPLYANASVVSSRAYTQSVQVQDAGGSGVFASGNGTYSGREVIAASNASFDDLSSWLAQMNQSPPAGFAPLETGGNPNERAAARDYGIDYAVFEKKDGGKTLGLLVVVMDPQRVDQKFGRVIGMIAKYRALPAIMRAPIDGEAKARFGLTITQATQPDSPIGAALAALAQLQHTGSRGIVLLDAVKR